MAASKPTSWLSGHLTPAIQLNGIRSLVRFGNLVRPLAHPVLYPRQSIPQGYT